MNLIETARLIQEVCVRVFNRPLKIDFEDLEDKSGEPVEGLVIDGVWEVIPVKVRVATIGGTRRRTHYQLVERVGCEFDPFDVPDVKVIGTFAPNQIVGRVVMQIARETADCILQDIGEVEAARA